MLLLFLSLQFLYAVMDSCPRPLFPPDVRIGSYQEVEEAFAYISAVTLDDAENLYVAEPSEPKIRIFNRQGRFLRSIGKRGHGPGEFLEPRSIGILDHQLWVLDGASRATTFMDLEGRVQKTITPEPSLVPGVTVHALTPIDTTKYLALIRVAPQAVRAGITTARPVIIVSGGKQVANVVTTLPISRNAFVELRAPDGSPLIFTNPLNDDAAVVPLPGEDALLVVQGPRPVSPKRAFYSVTRLTLDGDTVYHRLLSYRPLRISPRKAGQITETMSAFQGRFRVDRRLWPEILGLSGFYPPVSAVRLAMDGRLWIRREETEHSLVRWDILDPRGSLECTVELPTRLRVLWIGRNYLWSAEQDQLGVDYLVRLRLPNN